MCARLLNSVYDRPFGYTHNMFYATISTAIICCLPFTAAGSLLVFHNIWMSAVISEWRVWVSLPVCSTCGLHVFIPFFLSSSLSFVSLDSSRGLCVFTDHIVVSSSGKCKVFTSSSHDRRHGIRTEEDHDVWTILISLLMDFSAQRSQNNFLRWSWSNEIEQTVFISLKIKCKVT